MLKKLYNNYRTKQAKARPLDDCDFFFNSVKGIVHIGAHRGAERHLYNAYDFDVLWVEANPDTFAVLGTNIRHYPKQRGINGLISDTDGIEIPFYVASNSGASSSMYAFGKHSEIHPEVTTANELILKTRTMASLIAEKDIQMDRYDALILDVQGAEMNVLMGMEAYLDGFEYLKIEAADYEAYQGGTTLREIRAYFDDRNFVEVGCFPTGVAVEGETYYEVVFRRAPAA
jgi:FkbM family methyltransferase